MNTLDVEQQIIRQLRKLPAESVAEVLDFTLFLQQRQLISKHKITTRSSDKLRESENARQLGELGGSEPGLELPPRRRSSIEE